jgi:type IV secretory pathway VirB6-like protein
MGIVNNPGYRMAVSALLSLYIMWTALSYLVGNVQVTHTELIVRVMKIAVVSALLSSEYSWTFFNDYLTLRKISETRINVVILGRIKRKTQEVWLRRYWIYIQTI